MGILRHAMTFRYRGVISAGASLPIVPSSGAHRFNIIGFQGGITVSGAAGTTRIESSGGLVLFEFELFNLFPVIRDAPSLHDPLDVTGNGEGVVIVNTSGSDQHWNVRGFYEKWSA